MMAIWTPEAVWIGPCPNMTPGGMRTVFGLVLHIQAGNQQGSISWFRNPKAKVSSHFLAPKVGPPVQIVDTKDKAWCQSAGNANWLSIENEGYPGDRLTPDQLESCARIFARVHREHGVPLQATDNPNGRGLGWHGMGGAAWGGHTNCPGAPIVAQRGDIIARANEIINGGAKPPEPEGDAVSAFLYQVGGDDIFLYDGGRYRYLTPAEYHEIRNVAPAMGLFNGGEVLQLSCHVGARIRPGVTLYQVPSAPTQEERDEIWATDGTSRWHVPDATALGMLRLFGDVAYDGAVQSFDCHIGAVML